MKQRIISVLLTLVMVLTTVDISAFAMPSETATESVEMQLESAIESGTESVDAEVGGDDEPSGEIPSQSAGEGDVTEGSSEESKESTEGTTVVPGSSVVETTEADLPETTEEETETFTEEITTVEETETLIEESTEIIAEAEKTSNVSVWDGSIAEEFAGGDGSEADPYQINNAEQFALLANNLSNGRGQYNYYKLTSDIWLNEDLDNPKNNWTPISDFLYRTLDGNNYTIHNLYIESDDSKQLGLFRDGYNADEITNLTIENVKIVYNGTETGYWVGAYGGKVDDMEACAVTGTMEFVAETARYSYIGGLAAINYGTMNNCTMEADLLISVSSEGSQYLNVGGVVAYNRGTMTYCKNKASIETSSNYVIAGIVQRNEGTVKWCENSAEAVVKGVSAAGIAGSSTGEAALIAFCHNYGTVNGSSYAVGIVSSVSGGTIQECTNEGRLIAEKTIAGIMGSVSSSSYAVVVLDCVNKADLGTTGVSKVAGITLSLSYSNTSALGITVRGCINEGDLYGQNVAGIVCDYKVANGHSLLYECENHGTITADVSAAGIVHSMGTDTSKGKTGYPYISACINKGAIIAKDQCAAGIVYRLGEGNVNSCYNTAAITGEYASGIAYKMGTYYSDLPIKTGIKECYNLGSVSGYSIAGGVVGDMSNGEILSCYNMGALELLSGDYSPEAGGIVSSIFPFMDSVQISDCFNCGTIIFAESPDYAGGLVGSASAYQAYDLKIENCYNIGKIKLAEGVDGRKDYIGSAFGTVSEGNGDLILSGIYAMDSEYEPVGYDYKNVAVGAVTVCSDSEMMDSSTFDDVFDMSSVWKMGKRKYPYPILNGVGEAYLTRGYGGSGSKTVFSEYVIKVVNDEDGHGIPYVAVDFENESYITDENGIIRVMASNKEMGTATFTHTNYEEKEETVVLKDGEACVIELKRKVEVRLPNMNFNGTTDLEGGNVKVDDVSSNMIDIPFKFSFKANWKKTLDKNEATGGKRSAGVPIKIVNDYDRQLIKISFGGSFTDEKSYKQVKDIIDRCKKSTRSQNDVLKVLEKNGVNTCPMEVGVSASACMLGYITIDYSSGEFETVESQAMIAVKGGGELTYRPYWAGGVAYGKIGVEFSATGNIVCTVDPELAKICNSMNLELEQALTLAVGVGTSNAHLEVGATGSLTETLVFDGSFDVNKDLTVNIAAVPYLEAKAWMFQGKVEYTDWKGQLWPKKASSTESTKSLQYLAEAADYTMIDRDYIEEVSSITPQRSMTYSARSGASALNQDSVYPDGSPQICELSDGTKIAVWIADDGTKADADRTTLYYAVEKNGVFSTPVPVAETGRGDYSPTLYAKGENAWVLWSNADKTFGDTATLEDMSTSMNLYLSAFDNASGCFTTPVCVTEERGKAPAYTDITSDGRKVTVTWVENSDNSVFMGSGTNTIYNRTYATGELSDIKNVAEGIACMEGMDTAYVQNSYVVVWSQDTDGNLATGEDMELFMVKDGVKTQLTSNQVSDASPVIAGEDLYFNSDNMLRRMKNLDKNLSESTGLSNVDDYRILTGTLGTAIVWMEKEGFVTRPVVSYEKSDAFTAPILLTDMGDVNISDYNALYEDDGSISMFYNVRSVNLDWTLDSEEESPYGDTSMKYFSLTEEDDLIVDEFLFYDRSTVEAGGEVTFSAEVYNRTAQEIEQLQLVLSVDGTEVKSETVNTTLAAGDTGDVSISYTLPEDLELSTYELTVSSAQIGEVDSSNNSASAEVGYANVELKDWEVEAAEDGSAVITGVVTNSGYTAVSDVVLKVQQNGEEGEIISEESSISLQPGDTREIEVEVSAEDAAFETAVDGKRFYVSVTTEQEELFYGDNSEALLLTPVEAETLELGENLTLSVGQTSTLAPVLTPVNAYQECVYVSSDISVAVVDETGVLTALKSGTVTITAMAVNGDAKDSITVSVEAPEEEKWEYFLDSESLSMDNGSTKEIALTWEDITEDESAGAPTGMLTWKSSDETIFTVEAKADSADEENAIAGVAVLTGKKAGTAVLTVVTEDGGAASCKVTVKDDSIRVAVFEENYVEMKVGEEEMLAINCSPAGNGMSDFTISSDNDAVATVDENGIVHALAQGSAIITAVYNQDSEVKASCEIEVTDPALTTYAISFDSNGGTPIPDNRSNQILYTGETFIFPDAPTRPGYYFGGWGNEEGTEILYRGSETLIAGEDVTDSLYLYAVWIAEEDGMWAADITDQVYTGSKIKPALAIYDGTKLLIEGKDYTVSYRNNIKAADKDDNRGPSVIIRGRGSYSGNQTLTFTILPRDIGSSEGMEVENMLLQSNGKVQQPLPTVTWNGKRLKNNTDYTVEYPDLADNPDAYKEPGTYTVRIVGKGNYTGERTVTLTITDGILMSRASVGRIAKEKYTGEAICPKPVVTYKGTVLTEGTHYNLSYKNNVKPGKAEVIITGTNEETPEGTFAGEKKVIFTITGVSLRNVTVDNISQTAVYNGQEITTESACWGDKPVLTMMLDGEPIILTEGVDYSVSYQSNTNAGNGKIIFTGINGYIGSVKKVFKIAPYNMAVDGSNKISISVEEEVPYEKGGVKPEPVVTWGGDILTKNVDYTLSYKNNKSLNDGSDPDKMPTIIIKGKNNFTGAVEVTYKIIKSNIGDLQIAIPDVAIDDGKGSFISKPTSIDVNGTSLKAGVDYEDVTYTYAEDVTLSDGTFRAAGSAVEKDDIPLAGTRIKVTIQGIGNYEGTLEGEYRVVEESIADAKVTIPDQIYNGKAITIPKDQIQVKIGSTILTEDDFDIIGYSDNVEKGTAKLIIQGKGDFGGTKTVKFRIRSKGIFWWWTDLVDKLKALL